MAAWWCFALLLVLCAPAGADVSKGKWEPLIRMPGEKEPATARGFEGPEEEDGVGTRWAVLIAGSSGYGNYRHQVSGWPQSEIVGVGAKRVCARCRCVWSTICLGMKGA